MRATPVRYTRYLLLIAGLGGLLYGIDIGVIAAALLYLSKTIDLTVSETSIVVAAVLGGGMCSSLIGGALADWLGRRTMMTVSGFMFLASVGLIVVSQGFVPLFLGRLFQGMSGGIIAVAVPLYLAETLPARSRGRGTALFQLMLTFGIVVASLAGWFYTRQAEIAIAAAAGHPAIVRAAENHAWRAMFLIVLYPGILFFLGSFALSETPRWLFDRGRKAGARSALRRSLALEEADRTLEEMETREMEARHSEQPSRVASATSDSLFRRRYLAPFLLACLILVFNQTTGINSVLSFLVVILQQAGMSARHATEGDVAVKVLNFLATIAAVLLVDKKGRKFLLKMGTIGIVIALIAAALLSLRFESRRVDLRESLQTKVQANSLNVRIDKANLGPGNSGDAGGPMALTVLYTYGWGSKTITVLANGPDPTLRIAPDRPNEKPLVIEHAFYGPVPPERTGWLLAACLGLFVMAFAVGPGVVVWLALSELMPTRIRSMGMGIALLLNQGASTLIAALFLPVAGNYGYHTVFFFWSFCTVGYFLAATFLLPETKGKTLEEIEMHFELA